MSAIENVINQAMLPADRQQIMTEAARDELIGLRDRIMELETERAKAVKLVQKWRRKSAKNDMPTDRCIGFDWCADDLARVLKVKK